MCAYVGMCVRALMLAYASCVSTCAHAYMFVGRGRFLCSDLGEFRRLDLSEEDVKVYVCVCMCT